MNTKTESQSSFTFSGPQPGFKDSRTRTKGIMKKRRAQKRGEAEARNAKTPFERTRWFRLHPDEIREDSELAEGNNERMC
jgi:hypothetical protein